MASLCVSCGLTTDENGKLKVANSSDWGGPGLDFDCNQLTGIPIFCDSQGELRGPPEHTAVTFGVDDNVDLDNELEAGDAHFSPTSITYKNPSPCRSMVVFAVARAEFQLSVTPGTTWRLKIGNPIDNNESGEGATCERDTLAANGSTHTIQRQGVSTNVRLLAPGQSLVISSGVTTECLGGQLTVQRHRWTVHGIGVTV